MRAVIAGTGPSLTPAVAEMLRQTDVPIFGCNSTYQVLPLVALYATNANWWDHYWPSDGSLRAGDFEKWTNNRDAATRYGLNYIEGFDLPGLATIPGRVHHGHSSGYGLLNLALHYGVTEAVLVGHDLNYGPGYDGQAQHAPNPRHYFGEYPASMQHWTKFGIGPGGELQGLLNCYRTIEPARYGLRIINCSPGSALDFFETGDLEDFL